MPATRTPALPPDRPPETRRQVVGPTLGAALGLLSAVVCLPLGALTWVCSRPRGRAVMGTPVGVYTRVSSPIPF